MSALSPAAHRVSPALARIAPFAIFIALLAIEPLAASQWGDPRWFTVLRPLLVACVLAVFWRHYEELHRLRMAPRHLVLAIGLGIAVFAAWIVFDRGWAVTRELKDGFNPVDDEGRIDIVLVSLRLVGFSLVVPIMEELFWRSFLLRWIEGPRNFLAVDPRKAGFAAFAMTSALFASEHSLWFAGLIAGISYNLCFMRSRNLSAAVLSHAVTNTTLGVWILANHNWLLW